MRVRTSFEDSDLWRRLAALGPVCLLPRRTIDHRVNRDGLRQRGARSGDYLRAVGLSARAASRQVRNLTRPDAASLVKRADARVELVDAVRAIGEGDEAVARRALASACRLLPPLSTDPAAVVGLLRTVTGGRPESLALALSTAALWPEPRSDTARYLFGYSSILAVRSGRLLAAASYLARAGLPLHPGFLVRTKPLTVRLVRHWIHGLSARA
jgi:hypothetical protein